MALTVISGIILAAAGAFIFAFSTMLFSAIAFPIGTAMVVSGALILLSYLLSGRAARLPDTMLVEGIVSLLFGFAVLSDFVLDSMLSVFFGAWLTVSGATRISQSISVSRYKPKDWSKIIPLGMICTIYGAILMMPALTPGAAPLPMVGGAFIFDGLSLLVYAMYMKPPIPHQKELEAQQRAEAKRLAREEKVRRRNELRSMSYEERTRRIDAENAEKKAKKEAQREARRAAREAKKAERPDPERTIQFNEQESQLIKDVAEETGFAMKADAALAAEAAAAAAAGLQDKAPAHENAPYPSEADAAESANAAKEAEEAAQAPEPEEPEAPSLYPTFNVPSSIPSLRAINNAINAQSGEASPAAEDKPETRINAVNLEELESAAPEVEFEKTELPEVETLSEGGEAWKRAEIMRWLNAKADGYKAPGPQPEYKPLSLEDLIPETPEHEPDPEDAKRFTQTLTHIDWDREY